MGVWHSFQTGVLAERTVAGAAYAGAIAMNLIRMIASLSLTGAGLLAACAGSNQETAARGTSAEPQTGVTNAQNGADSAVVDRLATARCDREQTCNNIGAAAKYASRDVCMNQMRGSLANDLNGYNCPRGIDRAQLDSCMSSIKSEECSHPLDTLSRIDKCRTTALCMK